MNSEVFGRGVGWGRLAPVLAFVFVTSVARYTQPVYNWDNLFYIGLAEMARGATVADAQHSAFAQARAALPVAEYERLIRNESPDDPLRTLVANDTEAFRQQLPFYAVKPIYPALILASRAMGVNGVVASFWISAAALGALAALCCLWLQQRYASGVSATLGCLVTFSSGVFNLGVDPRPDALYAVAVVALSMMAVRARGATWPLALLFPCAILIRPDAVLMCVAVAVCWWLINAAEWRKPVASLFLSAACYTAVTRLAGSYSWLTLMHHCCIKYLPYPATQPIAASLHDLLHIYVRYGQPVYSQTFLTMVLVSVAAIIAALLTHPWRSAPVLLAIAMLTTIGLSFLVHPVDNLRVRSAYYVVSLLMLLSSLGRQPIGPAAALRRRLLVERAPDLAGP
jgi:hypothetical protein